MDSRTRMAFGLLVLSQAVHSIEEYVSRLFDVFALTRFVSGLISRDLATINITFPDSAVGVSIPAR